MPTYEEAFNAQTEKGAAARKKYGGDLAKFTDAAKAYNTKQAASKKKNVVIDDQGNKGNPSGTGPGPMTSPTTTPAPELAKEETQMGNLGAQFDARDTRQNRDMLTTTTNLAAGKLKNISRGKYGTPVSGTSTTSTKVGEGGTLDRQGSSETYVFEQDMPDEKPEFESRASKRSDRGPRYGGGQQKSPWANKIAGGMRSGVESGSHQGVEQQKTSGEISKREHSKLQAKNVLGAGPGSNKYSGYTSQGLGIVDPSKEAPTNREIRQKARDIRKTGRATDRRTKSDAKAQAAQKAGDARLGLDLSSASKRDPSKTDSYLRAQKKDDATKLALLTKNTINKNIV